MRHALLAAAAALLLVTPAAAHAADWWRFLEGPPLDYYIDADTITDNGQWIRYEQYAVYAEVTRTGMKATTVRIEVDCRRRVFRILHFIAYGPSGALLQELDDPGNGEEYKGEPGSGAEGAIMFVCDNDRSGERVPDPRPALP